jgi:hypothetical protein
MYNTQILNFINKELFNDINGILTSTKINNLDINKQIILNYKSFISPIKNILINPNDLLKLSNNNINCNYTYNNINYPTSKFIKNIFNTNIHVNLVTNSKDFNDNQIILNNKNIQQKDKNIYKISFDIDFI